MYQVYVLRSLKNGKRYAGMTTKDVGVRLREHHSGSSRWTRQNGPFEVVYTEEFPDKQSAHRRERFLKSGQGREALPYILSRNPHSLHQAEQDEATPLKPWWA